MKDRSQKISRLFSDAEYRSSYVRAKLSVLVPSQIRALRDDRTQQELADIAKMKQSRISSIETPGAVNFNLETLVRLAAAFKVGLVVKFVSYSEMLDWENQYSQDEFTVIPLEQDKIFLDPPPRASSSLLTLQYTPPIVASKSVNQKIEATVERKFA